jgi:hypothetical protein
VMYGPLGDEPLTGREAVLEAMRGVGAVATNLTYKEVLSGETHHAAYFRLQIEDTVVNGMDYILLDADGKIAEVTIWWRPLPSGVQMQGHLAGLLGMQPWELLTDNGVTVKPDPEVGKWSPHRTGRCRRRVRGRPFRAEPGHQPQTSPTLATGPRVVRTLRSTLSEATIGSDH